MNYRHGYHAGNFADVFKHLLLIELIERLREKDKPFCYLDTHAGTGLYDLTADAARRTGEHAGGIGRILQWSDPPAALDRYLGCVRRALGPERSPHRYYPGSPLIARALLRAQDRAVLSELHPEDARALKALFRNDPQVAAHHGDGYQALKAFLPPRENRGLVLIDPPFEQRDELDRLVAGLRSARRRWAGGIFALWYPVKDRSAIAGFHRRLKATGIRNILLIELCPRPADVGGRFNGCGMVIVNPPWRLDRSVAAWLPELGARLADVPALASRRLEWLVRE